MDVSKNGKKTKQYNSILIYLPLNGEDYPLGN